MKQVSTRLASRQFHRWLIPEKTVMGLLALGIILVFVGAVLVALAGVSSSALAIVGGLLLAIGIIFLLVCTCLCAHACCVWYVRDEGTQTFETAVIGVDQTDGEWHQTTGLPVDKRAPNGVLRDGRQTNTLPKKHVTISPTSNESLSSSGYTSGRQADSLRSNEYSRGVRSSTSMKSEPSSASSDISTLASFAYLNDPSLATPYSTLNQKHQVQGGAVHVPINVEGSYGSVQRNADGGRTAQVRPYHSEQGQVFRSNALPVRRHSDDDYDNAGDVTALLPHQTYQPTPWQQQQPQMSPWQLQQQQLQQQQQQQQHSSYNQQWQSNQPPPQQTVWQYQTNGNQSNWRHVNPGFEEPPPPQPLVQPSQRRPMTFEQISSSKVSLYDNMQMNRRDDEE